MRRKCLAVLGAAMAVLALAAVAEAKPPDLDSGKLRSAVTVEGIVHHQRALQTIATLNGGTRHTETPGYAASVGRGWRAPIGSSSKVTGAHALAERRTQVHVRGAAGRPPLASSR